MRKMVAVLAVFGFCLSVAFADTFGGIITKVEGNKITVQKTKFVDKKAEPDGEPVTLTAASNVKVVKGSFNKEAKKLEAGEPVAGGLTSEALSSGKARARITTEGDQVTEIIVMPAFGKKKKE